MTTLGIVLNTKITAISQYAGLDFNSMCVFNGELLGAGSSGLLELTGDTDNGTEINAFFQIGSTDLGTSNVKKLRSIVLSGYQHGTVEITAILDNVEKTTYTAYLMPTGVNGTVLVDLNSDDVGRYVGLKIKNVNGSDFSMDALDLLVIPTVLSMPSGRVAVRSKSVHPLFTGAGGMSAS